MEVAEDGLAHVVRLDVMQRQKVVESAEDEQDVDGDTRDDHFLHFSCL